jgi:UDP:flavonoid glycosyltransferase YjiC (YdhE family)
MVQPDTRPEPSPVKKGRRIVLTTFGSLGDFHPYVAIALGLKARGHEAVLATGECYRAKVEALGLGFRAVRPDSALVTDPVAMRRFMDLFSLSAHRRRWSRAHSSIKALPPRKNWAAGPS